MEKKATPQEIKTLEEISATLKGHDSSLSDILDYIVKHSGYDPKHILRINELSELALESMASENISLVEGVLSLGMSYSGALRSLLSNIGLRLDDLKNSPFDESSQRKSMELFDNIQTASGKVN